MKLLHVLLLPLMLLLTGCEKSPIVVTSCPSFPTPSHGVVGELKKHCMPDSRCPALWSWIDRLYILKDQLDKTKLTQRPYR